MPNMQLPFRRKPKEDAPSMHAETATNTDSDNTKTTDQMKPIRVAFRWNEKGTLIASVIDSDANETTLYGSYNLSPGSDVRAFCVMTADEIEEKLGRPVRWSMPQGSRPTISSMTLEQFCKRNGIPIGHEELLAAAYQTKTNNALPKNAQGKYVIGGAPEVYYISLFDDAIHQISIEEQKLAEERAFIEEEERRIAEVVRSMPITSTNGFEGYRIVEYGGYVSGDEAILLSDSYFSIGDFSKDKVNDKIKEIRAVAIEELKLASAQIGCNAVVGLDFDYVTVDRQRRGFGDTIINNTFIILTANGTAVTIEPIQ